MKKQVHLIAAAVALGLIVTAENARGSIVVTGEGTDWPSATSATISWEVTEKHDNGNLIGWTYQYCWDFPDEDTNISHLIIEVTPDATLADFSNFQTSSDGGNTWVDAQEGSVSVQEFTSGGSNPGMPEDMWGIKFNGDLAFGDESDVCIKFDSIKGPVEGDFFAKAGSTGGAWNSGFTSPDSDPMTAVVLPSSGTLPDSQEPQHIVRPNGAIPEPSTFIIWSLLGAVGVTGSFVARRKRVA